MMMMVKMMMKVQRYMVGGDDDVDGGDFCPVHMSYVTFLPGLLLDAGLWVKSIF